MAESHHCLQQSSLRRQVDPSVRPFTCSEVFFKRMNLPSTSISSMHTLPVAEAEWEMLTLLLASDSSTSTLFRFPRVVRTLRLDDARDTVTREEGLGESFNLHGETRVLLMDGEPDSPRLRSPRAFLKQGTPHHVRQCQ